jgi:hypothetical protein
MSLVADLGRFRRLFAISDAQTEFFKEHRQLDCNRSHFRNFAFSHPLEATALRFA